MVLYLGSIESLEINIKIAKGSKLINQPNNLFNNYG